VVKLVRRFRQAAKRLADAALNWLDDRRWDWQFAHSQAKLARLADQALADYEAGLTDDMDDWLEEDEQQPV
jgi:hypothetical protein